MGCALSELMAQAWMVVQGGPELRLLNGLREVHAEANELGPITLAATLHLRRRVVVQYPPHRIPVRRTY